MATTTELIYLIFHLIRFIFSLAIFTSALLFLCGGCFHDQLRRSKRQWLMFNFCIAAIVFAIINAIFSMIPLAPTYILMLAAQLCTLQHFLEDVAQGQVAYSLVALAIHQTGPSEWKNRSYLWFGLCVGIQWLCSYLLPLPQILMSNLYICFAIFPNQFLLIYSIVFLLALPVFLHLMVYIIGIVWKNDGIVNTQVYPSGQVDPTGIDHRSLVNYVFIMGLLFNILGYAPRGLLGVIDFRLRQSVALYAILEILPSMFLLIDLIFLYKLNKETRKHMRSKCGC